MACAIGQYGTKIFGPLGKFILCDYLNCAVIVFVMYFLILKFMGKVKFPYFMRKILPLWAMTAATTSSSGSLPVTMRITRDDFKVEEELYGFSLPLGATINMNAGGAYYSAAVVFAAQIYGVPLTLTQEITIVILATLISVGSPGIPGGGIVMTIMLLTTMGLPVDIMGNVAGIYKIIDIAHTTINCTGDVVSTIAVARSEGMIHDEVQREAHRRLTLITFFHTFSLRPGICKTRSNPIPRLSPGGSIICLPHLILHQSYCSQHSIQKVVPL